MRRFVLNSESVRPFTIATALLLSVSLFSTTRTNAQNSVTRGIDTTLPSSNGLNGSGAPHGAKGSNPDGVERWEWDGSDGGGLNQGLLWFDIPQVFLDGFVGGTSTAILKLYNDNQGDSGDLHRVTVNWLDGPDGGDNITYDGFPDGPGIDPGVNAQEVSNVSTGPLTNGPAEFDVTVDVLAWSGGEPNYGWGFLPESGTTDGNGIISFEHETDPIPELVLFDLSLINGDFNGDGTLDVADFQVLVANYRTGTTYAEGDFTTDGVVDLRDFVGFRLAFEAAAAGGAAVPEPSAMILAMMALAAFAKTFRRRR